MLLLFFVHTSYSGNCCSSEKKPAPQLINNTSIPLRFIVHRLFNRHQEITLQSGQTYHVSFILPWLDGQQTPDIEVPNQNVTVQITIKNSEFPDNGPSQYFVGDRRSFLRVGFHARINKRIYEFTDLEPHMLTFGEMLDDNNNVISR